MCVNCSSCERIMRYWLLAVLLLSTPAIARQSLPYKECMRTAAAQSAIDLCADQEAKRSEKELHRTYRKLLSEVENEPGATARVAAMESAWAAYRNRYMAAMYPAKDKQAEYGSMYPMEADLLLAQLTKAHVKALEVLLRQYGPAGR